MSGDKDLPLLLGILGLITWASAVVMSFTFHGATAAVLIFVLALVGTVGSCVGFTEWRHARTASKAAS